LAIKSRRKAREAAVRALYEMEIGHSKIDDVIEAAVMDMEVTHDLADYMERVVRGVRHNLNEVDGRITRYLKGYDFSRLAVVDKNVLRVATYELLFIPELPPAVTINEAVELAKRFSTAESGKFVNGVLGKMVLDTAKAKWDPTTAPAEERVADPEPEPEVEAETVDADSQEAKDAKRFGWVLKSEG
jgi:transcription antitermination protein NusB